MPTKKKMNNDMVEAVSTEELVKTEATAEPAKKNTRKRTSTKKTAEATENTTVTEKKTSRKRTTKKAAETVAPEVASPEAVAAEAVAEPVAASESVKTEAPAEPAKKTTRKRTTKKAAEAVAAETVAEAPAKKTTRKRTTKKAVAAEAAVEVTAEAVVETPDVASMAEVVLETAEEVKSEETAAAETVEAAKEASVEEVKEEAVETVAEEVVEAPVETVEIPSTPRRSIAFIGSECHPFVKTGGLGDVMYALPRVLVNMNCDVRVILPRYECIPQKFQDKMVYRGEFYMDLGETGRNYYVGIMEYVCDGVVYDFIDNQEFFSGAKPYTDLVGDIPKYCFFSKAALAALNYMNWIPDVIHCHDWQAGLVPVMLRTLFQDTPVAHAKSVITIHNLRFQGIYNIPTIKYWTGLPAYVFNKDALKQGYEDANMFKGGLTYADRITTVSNTYAQEIQTEEYGENLDAHLRYHAGKLRGIVNGIDYEMWNPATDAALAVNYDLGNVLDKKKENKAALQAELGLEQNDGKFVIGLISRLTDQKGLDLVNSIIPQVMDGNTQIVVLGTGDKQYEESFRYYENAYRGSFAACIQYDEARAHRIYAGADALLVPSRFEPCGLTQLNAMHYGTIPIVRETGGLKDTVMPYNMNDNGGNGFTFDRYDAGLLLDAINRAKTFYFTNRWCFDEMVQRDMDKDVSWENSARQYKDLYLELTQW